YMEEAALLCDLIYVMNEGRILTSGAPADLIRRHVGNEVLEIHVPPGQTRPVVDHVRAWNAEIETTDSAVYVFSRNGALPTYPLPADRIIRRPASLEDVFLRLAGRSLAE
ncbi:MAG: ABC transporter ATP-binding protein, partial [Dehalococcoidia bacterium]|nr:ABC transporter ATP-binding protein [Dehalococcoidia bacterium]